MNKLKSKKINAILVISAFIFNILIFAPLEIYYTNKNEFWFKIKDFLPITIVVSIVILIFLTLLLLILKKKDKKQILIKAIFALTTGLYIQGNFLNFGYNVLDGSKIDWVSMIDKGLMNTAIWLLIIIFPYLFKKLKKEKNFRTFTSIVSIFIILIEITTLTTVIINQEEPTQKEDNVVNALSNDNIFNLSKDENIIIFMSDTFEATYMNQILEQYPEYKEKLKDFTYFDNCTGVSFFTYSSMPTLLTGVECKVGNTLRENLKYCFENSDLYNVLRENNYSTEVYTEAALQPRYDYIDNLEATKLTTTLKTKTEVTKELYKYTMYRYLPHFLKPSFVVTSNDFYSIKNNDTALSYKEKAYYPDDVAFNEALLSGGITTKNKKKSFKFYQTNGMHIPYDTTPDLKYDKSEEYSLKEDRDKRFNEGLASINLLCNYIEELKKAGAYENTTIMFLADHGYNNRFYTTLLVKKANDNHDFKTSSAPVSLLEDLVPTILNIATNTKDYGKDFFDYKEDEIRTRQVYDYTYQTNMFRGNAYKVISRMIFESNGRADDKDSFHVIDEEYENENKALTEKYNFGDVIELEEIPKLKTVNLTGVALEKVNSSVGAGCNISKNTFLTINSLESKKDVTANFKFSKVFNGKQEINFKINGETIYTDTVSSFGKKDVSFKIPKEIWNSNEQITIEIEYPNAKLGKYHATMMIATCLKTIDFTN